MEGFLNEEEIDNIKELFEKVHNNKSLSEIEEDYLIDRNLEIVNTGSNVELRNSNTKQVLVTIDYFTVESQTSVWWSEKWDIVDNKFKKLLLK